ncbi:MAG: PAS domain S-box protein, partial [Rubrivivax sp.]
LGLWDRDLRLGRTEFNDRWAQMLGQRPEDVPRSVEGWRALVHPDDLPRVEATFQQHLDGQVPAYEAVYRMRHEDGRWIWVLARGKVLERGADGAPLRVLGTHMDLSQRVEAEQALRDSERQLAIVADAVPGPVSRVDSSGHYLFANAAYLRWFVGAAGSVVGRLQREVLGEERFHRIDQYLQRVRLGDSVSYETPTRTVDGRERWVLVSLVPDIGGDGRVHGHFSVVYDISDRKRAEDALRASEAKSRALLDNLVVGVVVHQPDTRIVDANPAACRLLGLTLEELRQGAAFGPGWRFVDEDGQPMAPARFPAQRVLASGQPLGNLVGGLLQPGQEQPTWLLCNAFPMRRGDGTVEQIIVTFLDISERRAAELERQALERQLRESQRMESIGTLAGGIAHDFNNILAAILGNAALARQDAGPGHAVQTSLEQIHKAGLRARSLVQQILAFSRRDPGMLRVQSLKTVLDETLALLRATLPATVRLDLRLVDADLTVRADATQLQQVLMNLATNAWHALPASGGRIE